MARDSDFNGLKINLLNLFDPIFSCFNASSTLNLMSWPIWLGTASMRAVYVCVHIGNHSREYPVEKNMSIGLFLFG